jgi:hypothetical protein
MARLSISRSARRLGWYRGVLGGSRGWLAVGAVFWAGRFARKAFGKNPETAAIEVLKPGQTVVITALPPGSSRKLKRR